MLSLCLSNLYSEYIMQNARLDKAQAEIKISGRNINNLRYADLKEISPEYSLEGLILKLTFHFFGHLM